MDWKWLNDKENPSRWKYRFAVPFLVMLVGPFWWGIFFHHFWYAGGYFISLFVIGCIVMHLVDRK